MTYLLDTNTCIALLKGHPATVRRRFETASDAGTLVAISSVVTFELWYGVGRSSRVQANAEGLARFLAGPFELVDFDEEDARHAGGVRAALRAAGTPIGPYDVLIAGQALRHRATLVTSNAAEFGRVSGLAWEDWAS